MRRRMIRFQLERLVDVGERLVELVLAVAILGADAIVVRLLRHQLDRFVEIGGPLLLVGLQRAAERERLGPIVGRRLPARRSPWSARAWPSCGSPSGSACSRPIKRCASQMLSSSASTRCRSFIANCRTCIQRGSRRGSASGRSSTAADSIVARCNSAEINNWSANAWLSLSRPFLHRRVELVDHVVQVGQVLGRHLELGRLVEILEPRVLARLAVDRRLVRRFLVDFGIVDCVGRRR